MQTVYLQLRTKQGIRGSVLAQCNILWSAQSINRTSKCIAEVAITTVMRMNDEHVQTSQTKTENNLLNLRS